MRFSRQEIHNSNRGKWWLSLSSMLYGVNEEDMRDLKYKPLTHINIQNMKYDTLYIIKDCGRPYPFYWAFVKLAKFQMLRGSIYPNEGGYSFIHILFTKQGWKGEGGVTVWAQSEIDGLESLDSMFYSVPEGRLHIAEFGSSFLGFMNWLDENPLEVKG